MTTDYGWGDGAVNLRARQIEMADELSLMADCYTHSGDAATAFKLERISELLMNVPSMFDGIFGEIAAMTSKRWPSVQ